MVRPMPTFVLLCAISAIIVLACNSECSEISELSELSELLKTDTGGNLESHMFLAAMHGFEVSKEGIVTIDGERYEIWPGVRLIA